MYSLLCVTDDLLNGYRVSRISIQKIISGLSSYIAFQKKEEEACQKDQHLRTFHPKLNACGNKIFIVGKFETPCHKKNNKSAFSSKNIIVNEGLFLLKLF